MRKRIGMEKKRIEKMMEEMRKENVTEEIMRIEKIRKKKRERRNMLIFGACTIASGAAAMFGINALPVMAAEDVGEEMAIGESMGADIGTGAGIIADGSADAARELSENSRGGGK